MNKNVFHILVVDDDDRIRELVKQYLEENHFLVTTAKDVVEAKKKIEIIKFDILVLDIMMPGESGLSLTKYLKKNNSTPIILLTAKGEIQDRIKGLELGADDYLGKPFEPKELLLRIKNILSKTKMFEIPEEVYVGNTLVNLKKLNVKRNNETIKINPQEKKILEKMLGSPGRIFSREEIGKIIKISKERTIDVMITRLRQKIESQPKNPKYLQTIRGSGYVLWIE
ncbi:MAG: response regulator [Pelagibacteraceae bacterium]|jgi:two-component system phosphate regulon response regulator OmpR|nr:DNA-binding response regulator [Candidatus Pelagibacter sp.]MDP6681262.1 response regulator [Pelagibacteraceae bacterium]MDP6710225.1 response regulator [Pelagibacteraceae bacterium]|tara:strand:+ start:2878 stop:3555 length:678 start_codon:yes stop_codon:yes gene_type:complete